MLRFIADRSEVDLRPPVGSVNDGHVHLKSENIQSQNEFFSLTTASAVKDMICAWWDEFKRKDVTSTSQRAVKFNSVFKAKCNVPSLRPYMSADDQFCLENPAKPVAAFQWLPTPTKEFRIAEFDLLHMERQSRGSVRVINFMEALLQAYQYGDTPLVQMENIFQCMIHATKSLLQLQVAMVCQFTQLRRDIYLSSATNVSSDVLQTLRHASVLGHTNLFPNDLLLSMNTRVRDSLESSLIIQSIRSSQSHTKKFSDKGKKWGNQTNNSQKDWGRSHTLVKPTCCPDPLLLSQPPQVHDLSLFGTEVAPPPLDSVGWQETLTALQRMRESQNSTPVGGRLQKFWPMWKSIGATQKVCNWLRKGYRLPFTRPAGQVLADRLLRHDSPKYLVANYKMGTDKQIALDKIVQDMLDKKSIEEIPPNTSAVFSRLFLRPKPVGFRGIIDLTEINKLLSVKSFVMDTPQAIKSSVSQDMWATSVDLSDAYHHVPIHPKYYKYLAFQVRNKKYWFKVCPFGLSPIPQVFTQIMETLKIHVRLHFHGSVFQYIDDWLLLFHDKQMAADETVKFVQLCMRLGLLVNLDKSEVIPKQKITHLGIDWDFQRAWTTPSNKQINNVLSGIDVALKKGKAPLLLLESLRGKMVAMEKQVRHGRINFRLFQRQVSSELKMGRSFRWVKLSEGSIKNLLWWSTRSHLTRGTPCLPPKPEIQLTTDASNSGWGAHLEGGDTLSGSFSKRLMREHINHKELLAVLFTLQNWGESFRGKAVHFWLDNRTAVAYLSKQGGTLSTSMTQTAIDIYSVCDLCEISLSATYIPGSLNVIADMASRQGQILKTEWQLSEDTFQWVCQNSRWGTPTLDLFANKYNHLLSRYGSPCPDQQAALVDALTAPWPEEILYAFQLATIMNKVVVKIQ